MDLKKLEDPFPEKDIEWRVMRGGLKKNGEPWAMVVPYVTNRAIMERLDQVCGKENWKNSFSASPDNLGVICGISVNCEGTGWITKWDGAQSEDKDADVDPTKTVISNAMKRAAVQWGIGRYLYELEGVFATFDESGTHTAKIQGQTYHWITPSLSYKETKRPKAEKKAVEQPESQPETQPESQKVVGNPLFTIADYKRIIPEEAIKLCGGNKTAAVDLVRGLTEGKKLAELPIEKLAEIYDSIINTNREVAV